jgi:hypothetical protein
MSDLTSLMQIAPTTAAGFMGINQANNEAMDSMKLRELSELIAQRQAESQRTSELHPLKVQQQQLTNRKMDEVEIPSGLADLQKKGMDNQFQQDTLRSKTDATNFDNDEKIFNKIAAQYGQISNELKQSGAQGVAMHDAFRRSLEQRGVYGQLAEKLLKNFAQIPADKLPMVLEEMYKYQVQNDPKHLQKMEHEGLEQKGATDRTRIQANASIQRAGMNKTAPVAGLQGELQAEIKSAKGDPAKVYGILNRYALKAVQAGNTEMAQNLIKEAETLKAQVEAKYNARGAGQIQVPGMATTPPVSVAPPNPFGESPGQGGTPRPQEPSTEIAQKAQQAWGSYDPQRYEYRVGPNGKLQRKEK